MTKDKALKLALEALVEVKSWKSPTRWDGCFDKEITAIKEALSSCQCPECRLVLHASDCAVHNEPAYPKGECNCGAQPAVTESHKQEPVACDGDFPEGFDASFGVPAQALRVANAIMCDVIGKREWDVPCTAQHVLSFAKKYTTPPQRKPLTDEEIWVLTSEYNDYDQHGEYFEAIFIGKPTSKQIQKHCHVTEQGAVHILNGGGRVKYEDQWYNLRKEKAAHGIKELKEYKK